jgi:hypothetical protein
LKDFSRKDVHVLARLDPAKLDPEAPLVHRTDRDFVACLLPGNTARAASSIRRSAIRGELWDEKWLQQMYFEALEVGDEELRTSPTRPAAAEKRGIAADRLEPRIDLQRQHLEATLRRTPWPASDSRLHDQPRQTPSS